MLIHIDDFGSFYLLCTARKESCREISIPGRIPQDHKGELKNHLLKKLPQNLGYKNCWSIPYQWFRWKNSTPLQMLGTMEETVKSKWNGFPFTTFC